MAEHEADRWSAVVDRIRSRATALAEGLTADVAPADSLPHSLVYADFVPGARLNIELFLRFLADGVDLPEADTRPLIDRAVRLVHDGMPLDEALANYRVGINFFWSQLLPTLDHDDYLLIPEISLRVTAYLSLVVSRIAGALVGAARQPSWDLLERRREIAADLLAGRDPSGWARDPELSIADAFLVAAIRLGEPTPGTLTGLRTRINSLPNSFLHRDHGGWTALIPMPDPERADPVRALVSSLALRGDTPHPQFWIGVAAAPTHAAIPQAYADARIVADAARCLVLPDVVCRREDMVFEYTIAAGGAAIPSLAAVLDPLDDQPLMLSTLDAYIDNQFNHNATARRLHIHRNTVSYRLARIADLSGLDPQEPQGISTLMAARIARRLKAGSFHA
ncbi:helix-turn-helix domain-containing protein [Nocardia sp. NPDC051756]|uniref:PucR family transcriptional regulator n=1 Tax=Nocardia sp. NPDC051756 TaxID=3154751 RepID=UPI00343769DF